DGIRDLIVTGVQTCALPISLRETRRRMNEAGIDVSLFIGPEAAQVEAAARIGAQFIELHTGAYAGHFDHAPQKQAELDRLAHAAGLARKLGVRVNAGHGLNCRNVPSLEVVPHLEELNIGHSIVSRAVFVGLESAVKEMLKAMEGYP